MLRGDVDIMMRFAYLDAFATQMLKCALLCII